MTDRRNPPPDRLPARSFEELARAINEDTRADNRIFFAGLALAYISGTFALIAAGLAMEIGK